MDCPGRELLWADGDRIEDPTHADNIAWLVRSMVQSYKVVSLATTREKCNTDESFPILLVSPVPNILGHTVEGEIM